MGMMLQGNWLFLKYQELTKVHFIFNKGNKKYINATNACSYRNRGELLAYRVICDLSRHETGAGERNYLYVSINI